MPGLRAACRRGPRESRRAHPSTGVEAFSVPTITTALTRTNKHPVPMSSAFEAHTQPIKLKRTRGMPEEFSVRIPFNWRRVEGSSRPARVTTGAAIYDAVGARDMDGPVQVYGNRNEEFSGYGIGGSIIANTDAPVDIDRVLDSYDYLIIKYRVTPRNEAAAASMRAREDEIKRVELGGLRRRRLAATLLR